MRGWLGFLCFCVCEWRRPPAHEGGFPIAGWHVSMFAMLKIRSGSLRTAGVQTCADLA